MEFERFFWLISIWCFLCFGVSKAMDCELNEGDPYKVADTLIVDQSGHGNFARVQDAIDSIPNKNTKWIRILVLPGIYREQVRIGRDKPCIVLVGSGRETTSIEFDSPGVQNPTFLSEAESFIAKQISFKNTYNLEGHREVTQAVALGVKGDKSSFYECGFYGVQDTLWDTIGRHYFVDCVIMGIIDFIWGSGQSIYLNTQIVINGDKLAPGVNAGFITAQGRSTEEETNGFVFVGGSVGGDGLAYLGRAYRPYATVVFYRSDFSEVVHPEGWGAWECGDHLNTITFAEYECGGDGAKNSSRVPWVKHLNPDEIQHFTDISFINQPEGWIEKQPPR